jgi:hypothetical protein
MQSARSIPARPWEISSLGVCCCPSFLSILATCELSFNRGVIPPHADVVAFRFKPAAASGLKFFRRASRYALHLCYRRDQADRSRSLAPPVPTRREPIVPVPDGASADSAASNGQRKRASASAPHAAQALVLRVGAVKAKATPGYVNGSNSAPELNASHRRRSFLRSFTEG